MFFRTGCTQRHLDLIFIKPFPTRAHCRLATRITWERWERITSEHGYGLPCHGGFLFGNHLDGQFGRRPKIVLIGTDLPRMEHVTTWNLHRSLSALTPIGEAFL